MHVHDQRQNSLIVCLLHYQLSWLYVVYLLLNNLYIRRLSCFMIYMTHATLLCVEYGFSPPPTSSVPLSCAMVSHLLLHDLLEVSEEGVEVGPLEHQALDAAHGDHRGGARLLPQQRTLAEIVLHTEGTEAGAGESIIMKREEEIQCTCGMSLSAIYIRGQTSIYTHISM